ncbi:unnamed protein product [Phaedon cochleariae]|uniref:Migration and invasion enhancer 1 n=1 Tax=Phaedon cochleariae TaxID=80249 RepID=A0A9P0GRQ8_PHACE|nr:unnamed protein product [Phaedon cochleariae]CAH1170642.1 unnamed protein product [Phaedon cochleariae]
MSALHVDIEYCDKCGYSEKFHDLAKYIEKKHPSVEVNGREGRRGSFEVSVNGEIVHSKLSTLAYPDYDDLQKIISEAQDGKPARTCKQQPITSCVIS